MGLDPDPARIPASVASASDPVLAFNRAIMDATADYACCFKPQFAHHAAQGAEAALLGTIEHAHRLGVPVILDAKRGDVGSTADFYAAEAFDRYGADAVTINPYLGLDAMAPFLDRQDKASIILCRTSNPGGADLQNLKLASGQTLYEHVATEAATNWNRHHNIGLVVGATQPEELARIRAITGDMPFLLPGIGAQGGSVEDSMRAGAGGMLLVSSSRAILYASEGDDFAEAAAKMADDTRLAINHHQAAA